MSSLQTMGHVADSTRDFAYWGDSRDWLVVYAIHRDSDIITRANFEALKRLIPEDDQRVETASHWLVGHTSTLLIAPESTAIPAIEQALRDLEDYPVVDEELWTEMEYEEQLDSAEQALRFDLHIDADEAKDAAGFVYSWSADAGGRFAPETEEWWPKPEALFFGYLAYRRYKRNNPEPPAV